MPKALKPVATRSERLLIAILKFHGIEVWHNKPLHGFYPDLWVVNTKVLIEVDGRYHYTPDQKAKDKRRSLILRKYGYKILRFSNWMVENRSSKVVDRIKAAIAKERAKQLKPTSDRRV
jgi:very-short-patch-repair endonuclease